MVYQASQRIGYIFACDYMCVLWCVQDVMLRICELCSAEVWVMPNNSDFRGILGLSRNPTIWWPKRLLINWYHARMNLLTSVWFADRGYFFLTIYIYVYVYVYIYVCYCLFWTNKQNKPYFVLLLLYITIVVIVITIINSLLLIFNIIIWYIYIYMI